jgi:hypothetical protein
MRHGLSPFRIQVDATTGVSEASTNLAGLSHQFVDWFPDSSKAECCGDMCDCAGGKSAWYCGTVRVKVNHMAP